MIENTKQSTSNVTNSVVNQANGDMVINNGLSVSDAICLIKSLVESELKVFKVEAEKTANVRLEEFSKKIVDTITDKQNESLLERFKDPAIQATTNECCFEYMKSGDKELGDNLIDLLIQRLEVSERTTEQMIIDDAIKVLPKLSSGCVAFLGLIVFTQLGVDCHSEKYLRLLHKVSMLCEHVDDVSELDIEYMKQVGCLTLLGMGYHRKPLEEHLLEIHDLFYRKLGERDNVVAIRENDTYINNGSLDERMDRFNSFCNLWYNHSEGKTAFSYLSMRHVKQILERKNFSQLLIPFKETVALTEPFTKQEVIDYHLRIHPNWKKIFDVYRKDFFKSLHLTPLGNYLAQRQLVQACDTTVPLSVFYKDM